jgi:hypothetical protein
MCFIVLESKREEKIVEIEDNVVLEIKIIMQLYDFKSVD